MTRWTNGRSIAAEVKGQDNEVVHGNAGARTRIENRVR